MGDTLADGVARQRHRGVAMRLTVADARRHLFGRAHSSRYFGGFWYVVFRQRRPC